MRWLSMAVTTLALAFVSACGGGVSGDADGTSGGPKSAQPPASAVHAPKTKPPRWFSSSSVWNTRVPADASRDARSAALVAELRRQVDKNYARRFGPDISAGAYSTRIYTVGRNAPKVPVLLPPEKQSLGAPFRSVPLPPRAQPAQGTDHHLVVWQPATDTMWEFFGLERHSGQWTADWGARLDRVSDHPGVIPATSRGVLYGATATGLPLVGGLITLRDLARGRIDHALSFAVPEARAGVWTAPAQRTDGFRPGANSIPEGAHFRLDPSLDLSKLDLPPLTRMIAVAVQRYGMILRDQSGVVNFYVESAPPGKTSPLTDLKQGRLGSELLKRFPWDRLQLLEMDLKQRDQ